MLLAAVRRQYFRVELRTTRPNGLHTIVYHEHSASGSGKLPQRSGWLAGSRVDRQRAVEHSRAATYSSGQDRYELPLAMDGDYSQGAG